MTFSASQSNEKRKSHLPAQLHAEPLEERQMLSTVTIEAAGHTGEENMKVYLAGALVLDVVVPQTEAEFYNIETEQGVDINDLRIEFTNDLYLPEQGIDRNLDIGNVIVDGNAFDVADASVFSTGTWLASDGVTPGFGRGNVLHANGYFQFGEQFESIEFQGDTWNASRPFNSDDAYIDSRYDELVVSGINGPFAVSKEVNVVGGELHKLSLIGWRNVVAGEFASDNQPWSTVGVDFFHGGQKIGQQTIELNGGSTDPNNQFRSNEFVVPQATTAAYVWVWIDQFESGDDIPLRLGNVSFEQVEVNDSTPPTATLVPFTLLQPTGNEFNFAIDFTDDQRLVPAANGVDVDAFIVTGPNDYSGVAVGRAGTQGSTITFERVIYGLVKESGDWDASDNGFYTITLRDNAFQDQAGNFAVGGVIGTFEIRLPFAV